jgi:hypothetical protein
LKDELKDALIHEDREDDTLGNFIEQVRQIQTRLDEWAMDRKGYWASDFQKEKKKKAEYNSKSTAGSGYYRPGPMEIDAVKREGLKGGPQKDKKHDSHEGEKKAKKFKCFKCYQEGHYARNCWVKKNKTSETMSRTLPERTIGMMR